MDDNDGLKLEIVFIAVAVLVFTSGIIWIYRKKKIICFYCILLSMCVASRLITESEVIMDLSVLMGVVFSQTLFIVTYCYIIDIFPTTHRGTALGFSFSFNAILSVTTQVFYEHLTIDSESPILGALYCAICIACAVITVVSPDSGSELPDRKHELTHKLSLEESNRSSNSS